MTKNLDESTGKVAFVYNSLKGDVWHNSGTPTPGAMTREQVIELAPQINFPVEKVPLFDADGKQVKNRVVTKRLDTGAHLGFVSPSFRIVTLDDLLGTTDALIGLGGGAYYDTAGALGDGQVIFALVDLGEAFTILGDNSKTMAFLLASTGFDGDHSTLYKRTLIRVVCGNTYNAAVGGVGASITFRHTSGQTPDVMLAEARRILDLPYEEAYKAKMNALAKVQVTKADLLAFTEKFIPIPPDSEKPVRIEAQRSDFISIYESADNLAGVPFTNYRLLMAATQYVDHARKYRSNSLDSEAARGLSLLDGTGADMKARAATLVGALSK